MPWDKRIEQLLDRYPALRAVGNTPLVPVDLFGDELPEVEVWAKMESLNPGGSLKDRPVLRMMLGALADGRLRPGATVLDSSSGNAGIAYAMIGRMLGVPVEIVIPDNASTERKKRLQAHGARLVFTDAIQGYDEALREVRRRHEAASRTGTSSATSTATPTTGAPTTRRPPRRSWRRPAATSPTSWWAWAPAAR